MLPFPLQTGPTSRPPWIDEEILKLEEERDAAKSADNQEEFDRLRLLVIKKKKAAREEYLSKKREQDKKDVSKHFNYMHPFF